MTEETLIIVGIMLLNRQTFVVRVFNRMLVSEKAHLKLG